MAAIQSRRRFPILSAVLALVFLSGPGCIHEPLSPANWDSISSDTAPRTAPRPVTADQVDAQNAHAKVQALLDEMAAEH